MNPPAKTNMKLSLIAAFLLLSILAIYTFGLGNYGLFNVTEAYTAQISAEMFKTGSATATPTFNGQKIIGQYPLAHLLQMASYHFLEVSPFAARLPFAVLGFLFVLVVYNSMQLLTKQKRFSLMVAAIVGLNIPFVIFSKLGLPEGAFWFLTLSATLLLMGSVFDLNKNYIRVMIAGFLAGGAVLAGGLVGLMIPLIVGVGLAFVRHHPRHNLAQLSPLTYTLAAFLAVFPWAIGFLKTEGADALLVYALQMANNAWPSGVVEGLLHPQQLGYYFAGFFPWSLFLPAALLYHFRFAPSRLTNPEIRLALPAVSYVWLVIALGVMVFVELELNTLFYMALLPTAILVADLFDRLPEKPLGAWHMGYIIPLCLVGAGALMLLPQLIEAATGEGALSGGLPYLNKVSPWLLPVPSASTAYAMLKQPVDWGLYPVLVGALLLVGTLVGTFIMRHGGHEAALFVGGGALMAIVIGTWSGFERAYEYREQPLYWMTQKTQKDHNKKTDHTIVYGVNLPSVRFEVQGIVSYIENPILALRAAGRTLYIMTDMNHIQSLKEHLPKGIKPECVGGYCFIEIYRLH